MNDLRLMREAMMLARTEEIEISKRQLKKAKGYEEKLAALIDKKDTSRSAVSAVQRCMLFLFQLAAKQKP